MERELWPRIYQELRAAARGTAQKYVHYHPWVIAAVLLWAALHDRTVAWACDPANWSTTRLRPPEIPSAATVSRRARKVVFAVFLNRVAARLRGDGPPGWELVVDGKPLPVGHCSKDPDARPGSQGRGYKLHAIWGDKPWPEAWAVTAMREYEGAVAERLLAGLSGKGVLPADGNYEASRLYDAAAAAGYQLLARPDPGDNGRGHRYQSPHRAAALRWFADGLGWELLRGRGAIERAFGNAASFAGGLGPLPAWVRRRGRVERWVWCKLAINAHRILRNRERMDQMQ
jgi:Transposase DDE domain